MLSIRDIRLQKLFILTVVFKVGTAFLGWYLQKPWTLGFAAPLGIMAVYIVLGLRRSDDDVSDEKFADTCYYLGFIFTITSIIFSLFDLPNIGTKIQEIAVRFGAAMVSTVAGLAVRVYLVSFRKDGADALQDAEDAIIQASQKFREQLVMAYEKLRDFENEVDKGAKSTVERVNMQVEKLSHDHSTRLTTFFTELAEQNQIAFATALEEVKGASLRLSTSVDRYSLGMQRNLGSIEEKVTLFADRVTERLKTTTFPDDYFSKHLAQPVELLRHASGEVATQVLHASEQVAESGVVLSGVLNELKGKAALAEETLDAVVRLASTQNAVVDAAQGQLSALQELRGTLKRFDNLLGVLVDGLASNTATASVLSDKVEAVVTDGNRTREEVKMSLSELGFTVAASTQATTLMGERLEQNVAANEHVANQIGLAAVATSRVSVKLDDLVSAQADAAKVRSEVSEKAENAVAQMGSAVDQLRDMVRHLGDSLEKNATANEHIANQVGLAAVATSRVAGKLDDFASAERDATKVRSEVSTKAEIAVSHMGSAVNQLGEMVRQLSELDGTLKTQSADIAQAIQLRLHSLENVSEQLVHGRPGLLPLQSTRALNGVAVVPGFDVAQDQSPGFSLIRETPASPSLTPSNLFTSSIDAGQPPSSTPGEPHVKA